MELSQKTSLCWGWFQIWTLWRQWPAAVRVPPSLFQWARSKPHSEPSVTVLICFPSQSFFDLVFISEVSFYVFWSMKLPQTLFIIEHIFLLLFLIIIYSMAKEDMVIIFIWYIYIYTDIFHRFLKSLCCVVG